MPRQAKSCIDLPLGVLLYSLQDRLIYGRGIDWLHLIVEPGQRRTAWREQEILPELRIVGAERVDGCVRVDGVAFVDRPVAAISEALIAERSALIGSGRDVDRVGEVVWPLCVE